MLLLPACQRPPTASDWQNTLIDDIRYSQRVYLTHMADNAMLHDMAVADFHFVPHTSELSGTGVARLERMGALLDVYGGTVRYETGLTDEAMVAQRLEHVREYLTLTGCNMSRVEVVSLGSGGRGIAAREAIEIYERETNPAGAQGTSQPGGLPAGGVLSGGQ